MRNLFILLMGIMSFSSWAGLLIEPYLAYSMGGKGDSKFAGVQSEHKYSSPVMGGRLGFSKLGFSLGLDYSRSSSKLETTTTGANKTKDSVDRSQMGVFAGFQLPMLLRFWGTYFFSGEMKGSDVENGSRFIPKTMTLKNGSGYALGIGYTMLPLVNLNLEYRSIQYGKYSDSAGVVSYDKKLNLDEYLVSISVPLNLF